jgi:hypothetical protein
VGRQDRKLQAKTAIYGPLWPVFYPNEKSNLITNYLENLFTLHRECDTDHERQVEARVQALLTTVNENPQLNFDHVTSQKKSNP